jgi:hypothetical protein
MVPCVGRRNSGVVGGAVEWWCRLFSVWRPSGRAVREHRARIWLGLALVVVGTFLIGDTAHRWERAWDLVGQWWPWALLGLAAVNLAVSLMRLESVLAPGLLAFIGLVALAIRHGFAGNTVIDFALPAMVAFAGAVLLLSSGAAAGTSWTRVLVTGRVEAPEQVHSPLRPRAILGEVKANLTTVRSRGPSIWVTVVFGHVHLVVPKTWNVTLNRDGALIVSIRDPSPSGNDREASLRVMGFCGVVSVSRV